MSPTTSMKFTPLGGADDIGASCHYLNIDGTGILLDCGIHPRKIGEESLPQFDFLKDKPLDFVLISHAHQDHLGALPFLVQKFPHVKIFATPQTVDIARLTLHNAISFTHDQIKDSSEYKSSTHEEIDFLLRSIRTCEFEEIFSVRGMRHNGSDEIHILFHSAGHILGAASVLLEYQKEKVFYTGDINVNDQTLLGKAKLPKTKISTLIIESTYANTESARLGTLDSEMLRFAAGANKILTNGGSILVPVFALGKLQEMLASVKLLMDAGKLTEANIYTGGLGRKINHLYDLSRYNSNYLQPDLVLMEIPQINYHEISDLNYFRKHPGIVFATSGMMLKGTYSYQVAKYWLTQKKFGIFIVGYMDKTTPGFKISELKSGDTFQLDSDIPFMINAQIKKFYFPTHSKREGLLKIIKRLRPERVVIVHGEHDSHMWLGNKILTEFNKIKVHSSHILQQIDFK